jgi:hypothetical protein
MTLVDTNVLLGIATNDPSWAGSGLELAEIPRTALFLAGKVFQQYRTRGGARAGVLPDFFVGAHAAVAQIPSLTRDPRRYRTYFSSLTLLAPDKAEPD